MVENDARNAVISRRGFFTGAAAALGSSPAFAGFDPVAHEPVEQRLARARAEALLAELRSGDLEPCIRALFQCMLKHQIRILNDASIA